MKNVQYLLTALMLTLLAGCTSKTPGPGPDGQQPSASFMIRADALMRADIGSSGEGNLIFQGWQYPFTFTDAKIDLVGNDGAEVEGHVFNLQQVEDFTGTYSLTKGDADLSSGVTELTAENKKGVVLHVRYHSQNLKLDMAAKGLTITLK